MPSSDVGVATGGPSGQACCIPVVLRNTGLPGSLDRRLEQTGYAHFILFACLLSGLCAFARVHLPRLEWGLAQ